MRENDTERGREIQERDSIARTASYHRNVSELSGSCTHRYISSMFAMWASDVRGGWSFPMALEASKTCKNTCFSKTPSSKAHKNTCFQTHLPAGTRKSPKNGKHAKTRVFALRRVSAPSERRRKSTQKHVLSAAGLGKDTQKHASFGGSTRKTRKNTCNQTHLPETRKNTQKHVFSGFLPLWATWVIFCRLCGDPQKHAF